MSTGCGSARCTGTYLPPLRGRCPEGAEGVARNYYKALSESLKTHSNPFSATYQGMHNEGKIYQPAIRGGWLSGLLHLRGYSYFFEF
jgi:hypothetical protein